MRLRTYIALVVLATTLPFGLWASTALAVHGPTCTPEPTVAHPACPTTTTVVSVPITPDVSIPAGETFIDIGEPATVSSEPEFPAVENSPVNETPQDSPLPVQGFALPHTL